MALSYARPDPSSPAAVASASFDTVRKGFDPDDVRDYLKQVAAELAALQEQVRDLEGELRVARQAPPPSIEELDEATVTNMLGEETARVLSTAREAAAQIRARAEEGSSRLLREAQDDATRLREQAELESARRRQEATRDAEAEVEAARQQGRDMVAEAREYRERVLADLAKRRELARQQLADLQSGRERLLQAFERARIVAVDVQGELTQLGVEPEELVNLAATTGPVPITVPRHDVPIAARTSPALPVAERPAPRPVPQPEPEPVAEAAIVAEAPYDQADHPETPSVEPEAAVEAEVITVEEVDAPEPATEPEQVEAGASEPDEVDTSDQAEVVDEAAVVEEPEAPAVEEVEELAPVVALFAGELQDAPARADDKPSVDDLFARLRAAKVDEIVRDAPKMAPPAPAADEPVTVAAALAGVADDATSAASDTTDSPFVAREEALAPIELGLSRRFKRALADEQNDVLDILRRREPVRSIDDILPVAELHLAPYLEAAAEDLPAAARAGARSISSEDPARIDRRLTDAGVVTKVIEPVAPEIVEPLRDRLRDAIASAAGDNGVIAAAVRSLYREWKTSRLDDLAGEMTRAAYSAGAYAVVVPGTPVRWVGEPGYGSCAHTAANEAAGTVRAGDLFPSGQAHPAGADGCRCLLVTSSS